MFLHSFLRSFQLAFGLINKYASKLGLQLKYNNNNNNNNNIIIIIIIIATATTATIRLLLLNSMRWFAEDESGSGREPVKNLYEHATNFQVP
jgi:hypothetical protein